MDFIFLKTFKDFKDPWGPCDPYEKAPAKQPPPPPPPPTKPSASTTARCYRCGKNGHAMKDCRLSNAVCNFCGKKGHIEAACITKQRSSKVNLITTSTINSLTDEVKEPSSSLAVTINNRKFPFLVDTGTSCNLLSSSTWKKIGTPTL